MSSHKLFLDFFFTTRPALLTILEPRDSEISGFGVVVQERHATGFFKFVKGSVGKFKFVVTLTGCVQFAPSARGSRP